MTVRRTHRPRLGSGPYRQPGPGPREDAAPDSHWCEPRAWSYRPQRPLCGPRWCCRACRTMKPGGRRGLQNPPPGVPTGSSTPRGGFAPLVRSRAPVSRRRVAISLSPSGCCSRRALPRWSGTGWRAGCGAPRAHPGSVTFLRAWVRNCHNAVLGRTTSAHAPRTRNKLCTTHRPYGGGLTSPPQQHSKPRQTSSASRHPSALPTFINQPPIQFIEIFAKLFTPPKRWNYTTYRFHPTKSAPPFKEGRFTREHLLTPKEHTNVQSTLWNRKFPSRCIYDLRYRGVVAYLDFCSGDAKAVTSKLVFNPLLSPQ